MKRQRLLFLALGLSVSIVSYGLMAKMLGLRDQYHMDDNVAKMRFERKTIDFVYRGGEVITLAEYRIENDSLVTIDPDMDNKVEQKERLVRHWDKIEFGSGKGESGSSMPALVLKRDWFYLPGYIYW